jgi:hypothetical protein
MVSPNDIAVLAYTVTMMMELHYFNAQSVIFKNFFPRGCLEV